MITPLRYLSLAVAFGFASAAPLQAETLLFDDEFQVTDQAALDEDGGRQEINREAAQRQTGSLAPTEYSSNGQPWQQQLLAGQGGVRLALFPMKQKPLLLSPKWSMEEAAGDYTLELRILPNRGGEDTPDTILVALGAESGQLLEGMTNILGGALVLEISRLPEPTMVLKRDGVPVSDAVLFQGLESGGDLAVRWKQNAGRKITKVEVLLNGDSILDHEEDLTVVGGNVAFGALMGPEQYLPKGFGALVIGLLRYTRE
jgi:hypothetical protein